MTMCSSCPCNGGCEIGGSSYWRNASSTMFCISKPTSNCPSCPPQGLLNSCSHSSLHASRAPRLLQNLDDCLPKCIRSSFIFANKRWTWPLHLEHGQCRRFSLYKVAFSCSRFHRWLSRCCWWLLSCIWRLPPSIDYATPVQNRLENNCRTTATSTVKIVVYWMENFAVSVTPLDHICTDQRIIHKCCSMT